MKKIMILGAGVYQMPLIRKARGMGLHTIVVSYAGNYPGFAYADEVCELDTRDREGILAEAVRLGIDGIVTTGTDVAVRSIGYVCDAMGLAGISGRAAEIVTDKAEMKKAFRGHVTTADFRIVKTEAEAEAAASEIGYPVMMKAVDVSGSRGVTKVGSEEDLHAAFLAAGAASKTEHFVVEKCISGREIGLDAFVKDGELAAFFPHDKFTYTVNGVTVPSGHAFPFHADETTLRTLRKETEAVIRSTGIDNCALNMDVMLTESGEAYVIEAGGRCGATCIPELITCYSGIDWYGQILNCSLGDTCSFRAVSEQPAMAKLLFSDTDGVVTRIGREAIRQLEKETGASVSLDVREGDKVEMMRNGTSRFGQVILETDSEEELDSVIRRVKSLIDIGK